MHFSGNQVHIKKLYVYFFIFILIFVFASPVLADYLGPDRTSTTASEVCKVVLRECKETSPDTFKYIKADEWSCASEGKEWLAYDNSFVACDDSGDVGRTQWDKEYFVSTTTITHPEATVTSELQNCTLQNGWCVTAPQLEITSNEPLSGYQILLIEGTRNTEQFACDDVTCSVPLLEGENHFEYWALSSWGDSSQKGTSTAKVDTVAPNLNLQINGVMGSNNWYTSNVTLTAIAEDDTSGILEALLSVDNGTYIPTTTLSDGVYHIDVMAKDNALNTSSASTTIQVDTVTPTLSLTVSGTKGDNNFYISNTKITANTSDATSGVALVQAKINNGDWINTNEINLSDGIHTYQFRVYDHAGNFTETPIQTIKIDTIAPAIDLTDVLDLGDIFEYSLQDDGSGLSVVRVVIEDEKERFPKVVWIENLTGNKFNADFIWDGKWKDKSYALAGEYIIFVKATDQAGNERISYGLVTVHPLSYLQVIPEFIVPENTETSNESTSELENQSTSERTFGGSQNQGNESTTQTLVLTSSATAGANADATTTTNILWGVIAASAIGMVTAQVLEQQRQREEEEARQLSEVQASVDAQNAAIEANRIAMQEQLRIQNWLQGQAILNAQIEQLESQGASPEDIEALREQGATQGFGTALQSASVLTNSLQRLQDEQDRQDLAQEQDLLEQLAEAQLQNNRDEQEQRIQEWENEGNNGGGSKPLFSPVPQEPNPSSWWDLLNPFWYFSDEPWPWESLLPSITDSVVSLTIDGQHQSLATQINDNTILTHNHQKFPLNEYSAGNASLADGWSDTYGQELDNKQQTRLVTFNSSLPGNSATIASQDVILSLNTDDYLDVVYWNDELGQISSISLQIVTSNDYTIVLLDPTTTINDGDSGGGAFFNGNLVGNTWRIGELQTPDGQYIGPGVVIAIVPPNLPTQAITPIEMLQSQPAPTPQPGLPIGE
jgi:hypothetical protein